MGWKGTLDISREEALQSIRTHLHSLTNDELSDVMGAMFGDNPELPYHGRNFWVLSQEQIEEQRAKMVERERQRAIREKFITTTPPPNPKPRPSFDWSVPDHSNRHENVKPDFTGDIEF